MKSSQFNILIKDPKSGDTLLFNSLSIGMEKLDPKVSEAFTKDDYTNLPEKEKDQLICKGYLVEDNVDEMALLKHKYELDKYDSHILDFTLAPTMGCNLKCTYCFEEKNKSQTPELMSMETQDKLVEYINNSASRINKVLKVVWFGGEPLVGISVIRSLTPRIKKVAQDHNLIYNSSMTTNGTLIHKNPNIVNDLIENDITDVQITLDGYEKEHNCRRMYKNDEGTFDDIISATKILKNSGIKVGFRINVDNGNYKTFDKLFDKLKKENLLGLEIGFGHLRNYNNKDNVSSASVPKFCEILTESRQLINIRRNSNYIGLPVLVRPCVANRKNSIVIDDKGYIYKCRTVIGDKKHSCGNVSDLSSMDATNYSNISKWVSWSPFEYEKCRKCKILPLCMGGCTYHCSLNSNVPECTEWKYLLKERLLKTYYKNSENLR